VTDGNTPEIPVPCTDMRFDELRTMLADTPVVTLVTTRRNGDPVATPIWTMVIDGVPYLRSAFGPGSWWYRHIRAGRPVAFALGDGAIAERDRAAALALPRVPVTVAVVSAEDEVQDRIDAEILSKYAGAPQSSIDAMLSADARGCTLRVEAATT